MFRRHIPVAAVAVLLPSLAFAQSGEREFERSIERLAESVSASAVRIAAQVERHVNRIATRVEREFSGKDHNGSRWDWDDDDRGDRGDRKHPFNSQDARSKLDTTIAFSSDGTIDLSNVSGDIIVSGWDRKDARIKAYSERGKLEYELSSSRITIEVHSVRDSWGDRYLGETRYELSVPRGARVIAKSTSGDITLRGTGGAIEANSTSGDVQVDDASGRAELGTVSGDIRAENIKGDVEVSSVSGSIELERVSGDVRMSTTSGDLTLTDITSRQVEASTTSGEIVFDGSIASDGRYEFHSHSGGVELTIPASASARFSVETFSGEIDSAFPITLQPGDRSSRRQKRFEFTIGSGGARVVAESFSGDVDIRKR